MINAKDILLKYPDGTIGLIDINLEVDSGQVVYITGPSGSGKTSFLKLLMGMVYPTSGLLTVLDESINSHNDRNIRKLRKSIGPIFQDFRLLDGRTVLDNVLIGMRFLDFSKTEMIKSAKDTINRVGLEHKTLSMVDNLSYGERQRVAIARAMARKPRLIIADEPTGNLDKANSLNILDLLTSYRDSNTSVIITTHATHLIQDATDCRKIKILSGKMTIEEAKYESSI